LVSDLRNVAKTDVAYAWVWIPLEPLTSASTLASTASRSPNSSSEETNVSRLTWSISQKRGMPSERWAMTTRLLGILLTV
jgi:hypothetical protein